MLRIGWPLCSGIGGRNAPEYALLIAKWLGDQGRTPVEEEFGPFLNRHQVHAGGLTGQFDHFGKGVCIHGPRQQPQFLTSKKLASVCRSWFMAEVLIMNSGPAGKVFSSTGFIRSALLMML